MSRPAAVPVEFDRYLGIPLSDVPSPDGGGGSYARHYGLGFERVWKTLGGNRNAEGKPIGGAEAI